MNEDELKKGCGELVMGSSYMGCGKDLKRKAFENPSLSLYCGIEVFVSESVGLKVILCPTCQARLEGFQKGKLEERERILKLIDKEIEFWKAKPNEVVNIVFGLECLKEQLQKEIGGMK